MCCAIGVIDLSSGSQLGFFLPVQECSGSVDSDSHVGDLRLSDFGLQAGVRFRAVTSLAIGWSCPAPLLLHKLVSCHGVGVCEYRALCSLCTQQRGTLIGSRPSTGTHHLYLSNLVNLSANPSGGGSSGRHGQDEGFSCSERYARRRLLSAIERISRHPGSDLANSSHLLVCTSGDGKRGGFY